MSLALQCHRNSVSCVIANRELVLPDGRYSRLSEHRDGGMAQASFSGEDSTGKGVVSESWTSELSPWSWSEAVSISLRPTVSEPGALVCVGSTGLLRFSGFKAGGQGTWKTKASSDRD